MRNTRTVLLDLMPIKFQLLTILPFLLAHVSMAASFSAVEPSITKRYVHTAALLPNGKVLVVGGYSNGTLTSAELYDPATNAWTAAGSLAQARYDFSATLLPDGRVLVVGGIVENTYLASAEVYDPATNAWSAAGSLTTGRRAHTATLLLNGKILVVGGSNSSGVPSNAEVYNPTTNTWSSAGSTASQRGGHTATLLPDGKVLIASGPNAELYNPASNSWSAAGSLGTTRLAHTAFLLPNGKVLVAGGLSGNSASPSCEVYDPATNGWTPAGSLIAARYHYAGTLLPNGKVLVAGGYGGTTTLSSAEVYDPSSDEWSAAGNLAAARILHTSTLLPSGKVLIVGGFGDGVGPLASAEVYDSAVNVLSATGSLATARRTHTATLLPNGRVLVAGGFGGNALSSAELYAPATKDWSAAASLTAVRYNHTATLLPNGKVLITGGFDTSTLSSSEIYDAATLAWSPVGSLITARYTHTATLLPNGRVLITGGFNSGDLSSTEVYNAATQVWSPAASLATARRLHTATLLPNGKVLVAGGRNGGILTSAELYDPATNTWSAAGPLAVARYNHTATLLPSGKVLVAGGFNTGYVANAEVYDPATNVWSTVGPLGTARYLHTATLLPNGKVLVAGGYNGATLSSTEVYDSVSKTWSAAGSLGTSRRSHTATLLPDGAVLLVGGDNGGVLSSAELFTNNRQFQLAWQPVISSANSPINLLGVNRIVLSGTRFKGISEASCGNTNNSASNYPLIQVRRIDNEQISFVLSEPNNPLADDAFSSRALTGFSSGVALVTVITNGIPSESAIVSFISNSAPTNISLAPSNISESSPIGTTAGTLSTTDADSGDAFSYVLASGPGSSENGSFSITGNTLFTATPLDFETKSNYSVRVRSTDANGLFIEKAFTISVTNLAPSVPTDSNTTANSVAEGAANGSTVGVTAISSDINGGTITYGLTDNAGGRFAINSSTGVVSVANSALLDFETANSHAITISATDGLASVTAPFTISVTNTNDIAPIIVSGLHATPNPAITGDEVFFTVSATDAESDALVTGYTYGDGSVGVAASHIYTAPGVYIITVTVSDTVNAPATSSSVLLVRSPSSPDVDFDGDGIPNVIDADDDGDGFDDEFELEAGSNPVSNTDTPLPGGLPAGEPVPLVISSFRLKLNFAKPGTDSITFRGTLIVPNGFNGGGQKIMLSVGGVNRLFTLNAKGASPKANDMFKISTKSKAGKVPAQAAKYQVKFRNGDFAAALSDEGLNATTVKAATRTIEVRAIFSNTYLQNIQTLRYTAIRNKWGKAATTR